METTSTNTAIWDMLAERWRKTIKAKALSKNTERGYLYTARRWSEWLAEQGYDIEPDDVGAHHVDDFIADIIEATSAANGAYHYRNLRVYIAWLVKRKQITGGNPMAETDPPTVPQRLIPVLTNEEHDRLFVVCSGRDFLAVRDTAIMLLFIDTGLRVSELGHLDKDDIKLAERKFRVLGKGNRERWVGFGSNSGLALARYLKLRDKHGGSELTTALWLNRWGRPLAVDGIKNMLRRRGVQAGISGTLHAHRFRHDFAHRWKLAGGSDEGLMAIGGWASHKMAQHYGQSARTERALAEQSRLSLADRMS
jgi:site-specific recombinase XerC